MKHALIFFRSEADFERAICLGITLKKSMTLKLIFIGDESPFYKIGIKNKFNITLCKKQNFKVYELKDYSWLLRIICFFIDFRCLSLKDLKRSPFSLFSFLFYKFYMFLNKKLISRISKKLIKKENPSFIFTDQTITDPKYPIEIIRKECLKRNIPVYLFHHGAGGGLHSEFSYPNIEDYEGYNVLACNQNEIKNHQINRVITGDFSSSYTHTNFLNNLNYENIDFFNDRKYKVAFYIGGLMSALTSTTAWKIQEEIIFDLSERNDVAMLLKLHPRESNNIDLRILNSFINLKIVSSETDRSRVTKWANICVVNDHTSVVFEPMILGKKVVAIKGKRIPSENNKKSPLENSSVNFITQSHEFNLESLKNADPFDNVTNQIAWGDHGPIDLANLFVKKFIK